HMLFYLRSASDVIHGVQRNAAAGLVRVPVLDLAGHRGHAPLRPLRPVRSRYGDGVRPSSRRASSRSSRSRSSRGRAWDGTSTQGWVRCSCPRHLDDLALDGLLHGESLTEPISLQHHLAVAGIGVYRATVHGIARIEQALYIHLRLPAMTSEPRPSGLTERPR